MWTGLRRSSVAASYNKRYADDVRGVMQIRRDDRRLPPRTTSVFAAVSITSFVVSAGMLCWWSSGLRVFVLL